ncbi:MAG TPA: HAD family hydrolase [Candidatus Thermoplasmatota archaeon]|nr:HAD family hydrolase [Candidatus Thermoplasmatota archaeon]
MNVQAVLFDLDNTLVDFLRMKRTASDAAARAMVAAGADFPFSADEAGDILFGEYLGDIEGDGVFARFLEKHHRQKIALSQHHVDRITAAAVNAYLRAKTLHTEPYPGIRRTLLELARRGLRLGVVTDAPRFKAYQRLDAAGLVDLFDTVVTLTDHGSRKPDGRPFREALEQLGLPPGAVVMVGDWPERDLAGAKAAGLRTAWASWGRPHGEAPPEADWVLKGAEDLIRLLPLPASR